MIFSGASGTRLWQLSKECQPEQFVALICQHTMLRNTARCRNGSGAAETANHYHFLG